MDAEKLSDSERKRTRVRCKPVDLLLTSAIPNGDSVVNTVDAEKFVGSLISWISWARHFHEMKTPVNK